MAKVPIVTSDSHGSGQTMNKAVVEICSDRVEPSSVLLARNGGGTRLQNLGSPLRIAYLTVTDGGAGAEWVHTFRTWSRSRRRDGAIVDVLVGVAVEIDVGVGIRGIVGIGVGVPVGVTVGVGVGVPPAGVTIRLSTIKIGP